jgi:hypothetical protein
MGGARRPPGDPRRARRRGLGRHLRRALARLRQRRAGSSGCCLDEVDIDDPNGIDTFLSVNNAGPYGLLGHVIVWTDMSVEALDFNRTGLVTLIVVLAAAALALLARRRFSAPRA